MDIIHGVCVRQTVNDDNLPVIEDNAAREIKISLPNMAFEIKQTPPPIMYASTYENPAQNNQLYRSYNRDYEDNIDENEDEEECNDNECAVSGRLEIRVIPPGKNIHIKDQHY